jgi:tetratricopeptide (TPR) repeat protein
MDYMLRGRAAYWKPPSRESYAKAVGLFEHALTLDPQSPEAAAWLATVLVGQGLLNGGSSTADIERAEALIGQALARAPGNMQAHFAKGQLLRLRLRPAEAIPEFETVIASNRNWAMAYYALGQCKGLAGAIEEVVPLTERAIRLSPRDPFIGVWYWEIGAVHLLQSRTDEAIVWFEKARSANSQLPAPHFWLASAYALKGETERAASELAEAQSLSDGRYSSIARLTAVGYWGVPKIRAFYGDDDRLSHADAASANACRITQGLIGKCEVVHSGQNHKAPAPQRCYRKFGIGSTKSSVNAHTSASTRSGE